MAARHGAAVLTLDQVPGVTLKRFCIRLPVAQTVEISYINPAIPGSVTIDEIGARLRTVQPLRDNFESEAAP